MLGAFQVGPNSEILTVWEYGCVLFFCCVFVWFATGADVQKWVFELGGAIVVVPLDGCCPAKCILYINMVGLSESFLGIGWETCFSDSDLWLQKRFLVRNGRKGNKFLGA